MDNVGDWLTYVAAAKRLNKTRSAIRQMAIRGKIQRVRSNDGKALVFVTPDRSRQRTNSLNVQCLLTLSVRHLNPVRTLNLFMQSKRYEINLRPRLSERDDSSHSSPQSKPGPRSKRSHSPLETPNA